MRGCAAPKVEGRFTQCIHYCYVHDVAALREAVLAAGAAASDLAVRFHGMKEFEMVDPSGHVLLFAQETSDPPTPE